MILPINALQLISEYSKPVTRGDWRTFTRITKESYIKEIDRLYKFKNNCKLYKLVLTNMHVHIDKVLYDMSQDELDDFILGTSIIKKHINLYKNKYLIILYAYVIYLYVETIYIVVTRTYSHKRIFKTFNETGLAHIYSWYNKQGLY